MFCSIDAHALQDSGIVSRQALESWLLHRISKPPTAKHDASTGKSDNPPIVNGSGAAANEASSRDSRQTFENDDIVCPHGGLDPSKASSMKRVLQVRLGINAITHRGINESGRVHLTVSLMKTTRVSFHLSNLPMSAKNAWKRYSVVRRNVAKTLYCYVLMTV